MHAVGTKKKPWTANYYYDGMEAWQPCKSWVGRLIRSGQRVYIFAAEGQRAPLKGPCRCLEQSHNFVLH